MRITSREWKLLPWLFTFLNMNTLIFLSSGLLSLSLSPSSSLSNSSICFLKVIQNPCDGSRFELVCFWLCLFTRPEQIAPFCSALLITIPRKEWTFLTVSYVSEQRERKKEWGRKREIRWVRLRGEEDRKRITLVYMVLVVINCGMNVTQNSDTSSQLTFQARHRNERIEETRK